MEAEEKYYTVLSAGFSIFVYWTFAVHGLHNLRPWTGFLFPVNSRLYYGLYSILEFILPTNGPSISGGLFCAPEYCSVFAVIQMYTADTERLFKITHFSSIWWVYDDLVVSVSATQAANPSSNPSRWGFENFRFTGKSLVKNNSKTVCNEFQRKSL